MNTKWNRWVGVELGDALHLLHEHDLHSYQTKQRGQMRHAHIREIEDIETDCQPSEAGGGPGCGTEAGERDPGGTFCGGPPRPRPPLAGDAGPPP